MKKNSTNLAKEVYQELRDESWEVLWAREVPLFDAGTEAYRGARVGLVRAIGVVAKKRGTSEQKEKTRKWLMGLLGDPDEKIRRYAMNALPKVGATIETEKALLSLLDRTDEPREMTYLGRSLNKIGGEATLDKLKEFRGPGDVLDPIEQKIKAQIARRDQPAELKMDSKIHEVGGLRIHLRTRRGLEPFVRDELLAHPRLKDAFKILKVGHNFVAISAKTSFTLADLYQLRTFGSINLVLGVVPKDASDDITELAKIIASRKTQRLCRRLTQGQPRYRLEFVGKKVLDTKLHAVVDAAFTLHPDLLNDPRQAPWLIEVHSEKVGQSVELRPRVLPDPRFSYRVDDVSASTHPPLAAAMARLASVSMQDVVWDPFCGSGQELIECAFVGPVKRLIASDVDAAAVVTAGLNFESAEKTDGSVSIHCFDFHEYEAHTDIGPESLSLIITNPPLGRRLRVSNLDELMTDFFKVAAKTLRPGGRLVFINPTKVESPVASLKLRERHLIDIGGFYCRVEKWVKS